MLHVDKFLEQESSNYFSSNLCNNVGNNKMTKLSTYDFSTLYTTIHHHLIKDKLIVT